MKKIFYLFLCLYGFSFQTWLQAQTNVIDEVIWVVGDDAIYLSDVENTRLSYQFNDQRIPGDPYCFIPEQLAIQKLYLHQAKLDSIEVSDSDVFNYVESQINSVLNYFESQEKLEEYFNKPLSLYREEVRNYVKEQEIVKMVKNKLWGTIKVTPTEVQRFYKRIPADSLLFIPTTVEVEIITLEPQVSLEEIDEIKKRLWDYTEQITSGKATFESLARRYSDDKETAPKGGQMDFMGKGTLVPEFAAVAFDLNDPKRVSRIVETEYGFHIIQLIEKRGDRIKVRHLLLRPYVSKDEISVALQKLDSIRSDIVAEKFSFEEAAPYLSSDKDTKNNKGLMVNTQNINNPNPSIRTGTSRFEMSELPSEIAIEINKMQVGEISKPFSMINVKTNREIVMIVKLKSKIEGHKANISDDFQALKEMLEDEKREEILNKWIAKKQKETYIRINDNWKNCDFERDGWLQK